MKEEFIWVKIVSIEAVVEEDVYDVEIEGTHNFIGNGIVAHNTYLATAGGSVGIGTTSPGSLLSIGDTTGINFSTGTSTFKSTGGIDLLGGGCFSVNGTCIGSGSGTLTALGSGWATTTGSTITFSTSTLAFNGLTFGQTIVPSASTLLFTPTVTGTLTVAGGGTGATSFTAGNLLYGAGTGVVQNVATSSLSVSGPFSTSGMGALVGGSSPTLTYYGIATSSNLSAGQLVMSNGAGNVSSIATSSVTAGTGVSFTGTAGALIGGTSLTINTPWTTTSENISNNNAGVIGIGTSTPRWALTIASSTGPQLALTDTSSTASPWTFRSINNNFYLATSSPSTFATSTSAALAIDQNGIVSFGHNTATCILLTGSSALCDGADATGAGASFPFTIDSNFGVVANSTTTPIWFKAGLQASSTAHFTTLNVASTTLLAQYGGSVGIGTTSPYAGLSIFVATTTGIANPTFVFNIASSSNGVSTTTLFSINNIGSTTLAGLSNQILFANTSGVITGTSSIAVSYGGTGVSALTTSQLLYGNGSGTGVAQVATSSLSVSGPFSTSGMGALVGGSSPTITYYGLSTTSALTGGQILTANGGAGVSSVATTSVTCGTGLTCTGFSALGAASTISFTGADPFTAQSTFNTVTSATSSSIWINGSGQLFASSTVTFGQTEQGLFRWDSSVGRLGIGTTTPFALLQLATSSVGGRGQLALTDTNAVTNLKHWLFSSVNGNLYVGTTTDSYGTSSPAVLSLSNNGNVSIGNSVSTTTLPGGIDVGNGALQYDFGRNVTTIERLETGNLAFETNAGAVSWFDLPVTSAAATGTIESYTAHINSNSLLTIYAESNGNTNSSGIQNARVGVASTSPWGAFSINPTALSGNAPYFAVGSSTGTNFLISNQGRVGVGTTSPYALVSIFGTPNATSTTLFAIGSSTAAGVISNLFSISNIGSTTLTKIASSILYTDANSTIVGQPATTNGFVLALVGGTPTWVATTTLSTISGTLTVAGGGTGATSFGLNSPIVYNGSTLVATSSIGYFDYLVATSTTASVLPYASTTALSSSGSAYFATSGGKVGIGTTSPSNLLQVEGSGATPATFYRNTADSNISVEFKNNTGSWFAGQNASGLFAIDDDNDLGVAPLFTLDSSGNAGHGSTTPYAKLSVKGAGSTTGVNFQTTNSSNSPLFTILDSGKVGVGTTSPGSLLSVGDTAGINFSTGTSTFKSTGGIDLLGGGCFAVTGTCLSAFSNSVAVGGTGATSFTAGQVLYGSGTNPIQSVATSSVTAGTGVSFSGTAGALVGGTALTINTPWTTTSENISNNNAGVIGIGTSTPRFALTVASSTGPQLSLADGSATANPWTFRSINSNFYLATSSPSTFATSTSAALAIDQNGIVAFGHNTATCILLTGSSALCDGSDASGGGGTDPFTYQTTFNVGASATSSSLWIQGQLFASSTVTFGQAGQSLFKYDTSTGSLGLGTTSPWARLSINADVSLGAAPAFAIGSSTKTLFSVSNSGVTSVGDSSGTGDATFQFAKDADAWSVGYNSSDKSFNIASSTNFSSNVALTITKGTANLIGIGSTTPWRKFSVTGTVALDGLTSTATGNALCITTTKDITDAGGGTCTPSSIRFKENIQTLTEGSALATLNQLRIVSFDYKQGYHSPEEKPAAYGLIAEEVEQIDPNLVDYGYDGQPLTLHFERLTGLTIQAVQEFAQRISLSGAPTTTPSITINNLGNVGIGVAHPKHLLEVAGDIGALSVIVPVMGTTTLPSSALTISGDGVDLYKLATYNFASIQDLNSRFNALTLRVDSIESRLATLEFGSTSASGLFASSTLAVALGDLGTYVAKGFAQFGTLIADQFVAATDSAGNSSAGSGAILAGNTVVEVVNPLAHQSSKIFITFTTPVASWYLSNKEEGKFRITIDATSTTDTAFDYFIIQTLGQIATSTASTPPADGSGHTAPSNASDPPVSGTPPIDVPSTPPSEASGPLSQPDLGGETASSTLPVSTTPLETPSDPSESPEPSPSVPADTTPPTITLNGDAAIELTVGDAWADPSASATDDTDSDLTSYISVSGAVDTLTVGLYTLTYSVEDAAGNSATVSRVVSVVAPAPEPPSAEELATPAPEPTPETP